MLLIVIALEQVRCLFHVKLRGGDLVDLARLRFLGESLGSP